MRQGRNCCISQDRMASSPTGGRNCASAQTVDQPRAGRPQPARKAGHHSARRSDEKPGRSDHSAANQRERGIRAKGPSRPEGWAPDGAGAAAGAGAGAASTGAVGTVEGVGRPCGADAAGPADGPAGPPGLGPTGEAQPETIPRITAILPTAPGRHHSMWVILLEALAALLLLIGLVWWTMFSGRKGGERRVEAPPPSDGKADRREG